MTILERAPVALSAGLAAVFLAVPVDSQTLDEAYEYPPVAAAIEEELAERRPRKKWYQRLFGKSGD